MRTLLPPSPAQVGLEEMVTELAAHAEELKSTFRAAIAQIVHERDEEMRAFHERRRIWEGTIAEWLKAGSEKRIDPILVYTNKPVYDKLQEPA